MKHSDPGRRSHEHAMESHTHHDQHLRADGDKKDETHLYNAMSHLHEQTRKHVDSLAATGHESHAGEPVVKETPDRPGV